MRHATFRFSGSSRSCTLQPARNQGRQTVSLRECAAEVRDMSAKHMASSAYGEPCHAAV